MIEKRSSLKIRRNKDSVFYFFVENGENGDLVKEIRNGILFSERNDYIKLSKHHSELLKILKEEDSEIYELSNIPKDKGL